MLKDYVLEGGPLMLILAAMFFVVLVLVLYAALLFLVEVKRARRFRVHISAVKSWRLESIQLRSFQEDSLPARFLSRLASEPSAGATSSERRKLAARIEAVLLGELNWPGEVLHFLGAYATKVGLCGTILGLCLHFVAFGTEGSAQVASRAMAVALYTTLGALAIALVAEPAAYALSWGERWIRKDLQAWTRFMDDILRRERQIEKTWSTEGAASNESQPQLGIAETRPELRQPKPEVSAAGIRNEHEERRGSR